MNRGGEIELLAAPIHSGCFVKKLQLPTAICLLFKVRRAPPLWYKTPRIP